MKPIIQLLLVLSILIGLISSQIVYPVDKTAKCEPYIGDSTDIKCKGRLANEASIYVTGNKTQQSIMSELGLYFSFFKFSQCRDDPMALVTICSFGFQECVEYQDPITKETLAFPRRTCFDNCDAQIEKCGLKGVYDVCSLKEPNGLPSFPIQSSVYDLNSFGGPSNFSVECMNPNSIVIGSTEEVANDCPYPFTQVNSTDHAADFIKGYFFIGDSNCTSPCPPPLYKAKTWNQIYTMADVISCLALISTTFLIFTIGVLNKKKSKYDKKNLFFLVSNFFMALSGVMIAANGTKNTLCPEPNRFGASYDHVCVASAFMLHFFAIYAIEWWSIMSFELWWNIKFVNRKLDLDKYYIVISTVIALVLPIICVTNKQYHSGIGNTVCWIKKQEYQDGTFFAPLGICLSAGTVFIIMVLYEIYKIISRSAADHSWKTILSLQFKPFLNVVLFYTTFLYLFIFARYISANFSKFESTIGDYFICISTSPTPEECTIKGPSSASLGYFTYCLRIYGVYCFFIYGISSRNLQIWKDSWVCNNRAATFFGKKLSKITSMFSSRSSGATTSTVQTASGATGASQNFSSSVSVGIDDEHL